MTVPGGRGDLGAVVLAGGRSSRLGGGDKTAQPLAGQTLLDRVLGALPPDLGAAGVVVVGERRPTVRAVTWTAEHPRFGGPVAALAAGLAALAPPGPTGSPAADAPATVLVLAGDLARPSPVALAALVAACARSAGPDRAADGAIAVDSAGRDQPLLAAYRGDALRAALPAEPAGTSMRALLAALRLVRVPLGEACGDIDTGQQLAAARYSVAAVTSPPLDSWLAAVAAELGVPAPEPAEVRALLDLTRDVAHGVERVAAPLTSYLVGVAGGPGPEQLAAVARALAARSDGGAPGA